MKSLNTFIQEGSSKKCPAGQYYCFTDKKCKKIPGGYFVGRRGYLEKEEEKRLEQIKKEIKKEIKQEMEVDEEFGKMTKKQTQAYTGMDDKEQKALYKKMKKDGNFDVKKNLAGAASDDKDLGEELNKDDKPFIKKLVGKLRGGSKTHAKQADDLEKAMKEESNPRIPRKKGQPANSKKHSDLYTDENPKGTIHGLSLIHI